MNDTPDCACCAPSREGSAPAASLRDSPSSTRDITPAMIRLDGGSFLMGTDDRAGFPVDGEGPVRRVTLKPFQISATAVTNAEFAEFAQDAGYVTEAERFGWSFVFHHFVSPDAAKNVTSAVQAAPWWWQVQGADWRHPDGPDSSWQDRPDHPVVHVSWNDAMAYAQWADARLPTEAEWEFAARGGLEQKRYAWGDELTPGGEHRCNIWQGTFPKVNTKADGYHGTAPSRSFEPNGYGLYNTAGNVWEWCADWFSTTFHRNGPRRDPAGPPTGQARVLKGGSYLCHASYCNRYRVAARSQSTPDSSTGNMGFRLAGDA